MVRINFYYRGVPGMNLDEVEIVRSLNDSKTITFHKDYDKVITSMTFSQECSKKVYVLVRYFSHSSYVIGASLHKEGGIELLKNAVELNKDDSHRFSLLRYQSLEPIKKITYENKSIQEGVKVPSFETLKAILLMFQGDQEERMELINILSDVIEPK